MSCQDFKKVVEELADGRLLEAAARDAGLAHAAVCVECAARLMESRGIGAGLKVAARAETEEAPARVKQTLLAAFAEQRRDLPAGQRHAEVAPSNVVELASRRAARWWGAAAAAAALLLLLGLTSWVRFSKDGSQAPSQQSSLTPPVSTPSPVGSKEEKPGIFVSGEVVQQTPSKRPPTRTSKATRGLKGGAQRETAAARAHVDEYLPLTYLADATAMESGTVVRVELSRSALISLGVPVEIDRSDELLKADVVLGDDGVARAIRLVR